MGHNFPCKVTKESLQKQLFTTREGGSNCEGQRLTQDVLTLWRPPDMVTRSSVNLPADYKKRGTFAQHGQCPSMATLALTLHLRKAKVKT